MDNRLHIYLSKKKIIFLPKWDVLSLQCTLSTSISNIKSIFVLVALTLYILTITETRIFLLLKAIPYLNIPFFCLFSGKELSRKGYGTRKQKKKKKKKKKMIMMMKYYKLSLIHI